MVGRAWSPESRSSSMLSNWESEFHCLAVGACCLVFFTVVLSFVVEMVQLSWRL